MCLSNARIAVLLAVRHSVAGPGAARCLQHGSHLSVMRIAKACRQAASAARPRGWARTRKPRRKKMPRARSASFRCLGSANRRGDFPSADRAHHQEGGRHRRAVPQQSNAYADPERAVLARRRSVLG